MSISRRFGWLDWALLATAIAAALAVTWDIWADIAFFARRDDEQSHILLALPIAALLGWMRRERLRRVRRRGAWLGVLAIPLGYAMARFGFEQGHQVLWHGGALVMVLGATISVLGLDTFLLFLPAFGALLFLIPVPGAIRQAVAIPLQEASAWAAHFGLDLLGAPVTRAGNALTINGQEVAVAEACNGMRMVAALALVSYAFAFSVPMRASVRVFILALSPLVAIVVNVVRLVPTVLFYGYAERDAAELFHDLSGWASLLLAFGILWAILALLRWIEIPLAPYSVSEE